MALVASHLESRWTTVGDTRIHARVSVAANAWRPSVVFVHGLAVSSRYMIPTARCLARSCDVYAPDLPGYGRSDKPRRALDVDDLSRSLGGWLSATGLKGVVLLANSFGCQIAVQFALDHPDIVDRLVLVGPTIDKSAPGAFRQVARWLLNATREPPSLIPVVLLDSVEAGWLRTLQTFRYALRDPVDEKLPAVSVPTLVVRGARDTIVSQPWAEEVTRALPRGRLVVIPGAAHDVNYNSPLELTRVTESFLED